MPSLLSSILDGQPSVHTMPDTPQSESAPASRDVEQKTDTPKADAGVKPVAAEAKPTTQDKGRADEDDDDLDEGPEETDPVKLKESVIKLRKSLRASRGDKKTLRQQQQETERKLAMLEGHLQALQQQRVSAPRSEEPKPEDLEAEFWKDPTGFVRKLAQDGVPNVKTELTKAKIHLSENYARKQHPDYDEKLAAYSEAARQNPAMLMQLEHHPDPAEFAYQVGAKILFDREIGGDPNAWRERERERIRAELAGEQTSDTSRRPAAPPKSIAGARGSGAPTGAVQRSPKSLVSKALQ